MNKSIQKVLALLTVLVMTLSLLPVITLPAAAATDLSTLELDYDALFEDAYIVWPTGSTTASSWTFNFRGESVSVPYSSSKCFRSFSAALGAFNKKGATAVVTETPVFVLVGTVTISGTIYGNAIFLGANAGINPNAAIDVAYKQANDPTSEWSANSARGTETIVKGSIVHANNSTNDQAAKNAGVKEYNIIIDGIKTQDLTTTLVNNKCTANTYTTSKDINVSVRNSILDFNKDTIYAFTGSADSVNTLNIDLQNIRMGKNVGSNTYSKHKQLFDNYVSKVTIDGLYYDNVSYQILNTLSYTTNQIDVVPEDFEFTMKNSIVRGNTGGIRMFMFGLAKGKNEITFENNIFYECGYKWGIFTFKSGSDWNNIKTEVNFTRNTVIVGASETDYLTLFEGGDSLRGPLTLNMTYNRIVGYESMFPTVGSWPLNSLGTLHGVVSHNYFATDFNGVNDTLGVQPVWQGSAPDHYHFNSSIYDGEYTYYDATDYYTDYKMTSLSDKFDVVETDFYDSLDYVSINNKSRIIRLRVTSGLSVSGLSISYGFKFRQTPDSVTYSSTSLSSSASTSTMTVKFGSSSVTYTIYAEGQTSPVSYTNLDTNDGSGTFEDSRLYLYSPSGATTATIGGITYNFSGRSYKTIAEIFSAAGSFKVPQIIIPAGTYDAISLTKACEIYGEHWNSPATGGEGADARHPSAGWTNGKETVIKGITLSSGVASSYSTNTVKVAGIVLTGAFTDTARSYGINLYFNNSVVNGGYFNLQNSATTSKAAGEFKMSGVKVNSVGTANKLITSNMPYKTTLDNVEIANGSVVLGGTWASGLSSSACALTVTNSYFVCATNGVIGDVTNGATFSSSTVSITGSAFMVTATGRYTPSLLAVNPSHHKSVSVTNNWFVNDGDSFYTVFGDVSGTATFTSNRLIGMDLGGAGSTSKDNNYYAPYTYDYKTLSNGKAYGSSYYLDPTLKLKGTDFKISSVSGGTAIISENLKTVYVKATGAVTLTFTNSTPYETFYDKDCTMPAELSGEGTYYVKATYKGVTRIYNVRIDGGASNDFGSTFLNDTIGTGALYVTSLITEDDYGTRLEFAFDGMTYSFVAGINAFASVEDALYYAAQHSMSDPKVILGEYGEQLAITGKVKVYGGNYATVPYAKTSDADLDWDYNEAYDTGKTTVTNIVIGPEVTGYIEIAGVEMKGFYRDIMRPFAKPLDVKISNILVNKTATDSRTLFDLDGNNAKNAANTETFTAKDVYIQSASQTRLLYEFYPANMTFDGLYLDCNTFTMDTINYVKNSGTTTTLTFKNSNLRNYAPTSNYAFLFQGDDTALASGESKSLVFENNIIYNFSFGASALIPAQFEKLSDIVIKNNTVLSANKTYGLTYNYSSAANTSLKFDVEDNILLGINPASSVGSSIKLDTASVIARNHTSATCSREVSGNAITITGSNTLTESVFALDDTMSPLYKSDFVFENVTSGPNIIYDRTVSGQNITVRIADGYTAADVEWHFAGDKVSPKFYSNSACTTEIRPENITKGMTFYMAATYVADDSKLWKGDVYTVEFTDAATDYPLFSHPDIDSDAVLIDANVDKSSTYYDTDWADNMYTFIVGQNVFATLEEAIAAKGAGGSYLIKDLGGVHGNTEIENWYVTTPGKYYTQNFDRIPYIASDKATDADGSEWTSNINSTRADAFYTPSGIKIKNIVLNNAVAGDYEFHGFTITDCIRDDDMTSTARTDANDINVLFNNTYIYKTYSDAPVFNVGTHFMLDSSGNYLGDNATAFDDSMTIKNTYYVNKSTQDLFGVNSSTNEDIKYNTNLWADFTIDGMFADFADSTSTQPTIYIGAYGKEYHFTVKNSNLRNLDRSTGLLHFEGHNGKGIDYGYDVPNTRGIILENNIFYDFAFGTTTRFLEFKNTYYNQLVFDGNYIYGTADNMNLTGGVVGNAVHPDTYVTITNNVLMGINPEYKFDRWVTWSDTVVKDNYCVATRPADTSVPSYGGVRFVMHVNNWKYDTDGTTKVYYQTNGHYWLDSELKYSADVIHPMTLDNGEVLDSVNFDAEYAVDYTVTTIDLEKIMFNPGNIITVTSLGEPILDINNIDVTDDTMLDIEVMANSGVGESEIRSLIILHESTAAIDAVSATLYNGIDFNIKATGLVGGEYIALQIANKTYTITDSYKDGIYTVFTYNDLAPHMMTEEITAKLIKDGQTLSTYTTTFADYIFIMMMENADNLPLYNLGVNILNYGATAQQYKNYKTDMLANDLLAESEKTIKSTTFTNAIDLDYATVASPRAEFKSHALNLDNAIEIKLGFTATVPVSNLSVKVQKADGTTVTLKDCFWYEDGKFYFVFDQFEVTEACDKMYFTIMNGNTAVSDTLAYSVESYAAVAQNDTNEAVLTRALMHYVRSAITYKSLIS